MIPFNRPYIVGNELNYITEAVERGRLSGDGHFTRRCQEWMEQRFDARKVLLTSSGTAALEMAALLCDIGMGDEVVMPSFTFVSTANAFVLRGARPVFVDIREDTLNLDEHKVLEVLSPRTRAIAPVHYAGVGCDMRRLTEIAAEWGAFLIEDAAQAVDTRYRGRYLGTWGDLGCFSFHETKNYISGEGGALVVNNEAMIERAEILWEKGTDRARFFRGEIDKYTWRDVGSSFLPSELVAAFLYAQLEQAARIGEQRRSIFTRYREGLGTLEERGLIRLPHVPAECEHNGHAFYLLLSDNAARDALLDYLNARGIKAVFHYLPLHTSPMGERLGYRRGQLPITESVSGRLVRLPFFFEITAKQQRQVIDAVWGFFGQRP